MKTVDQYILDLDKWQEEVIILRDMMLNLGLSETIKWGTPTFTWENKNVVSIAAFKSYVGLWFFQGGLLKDEEKLLVNAQEGKTKTMLQWRFYSIDQIVQSPVTDYILESIEHFRQGLTVKPEATTKQELSIPAQLLVTISSDENLYKNWNSLSPSSKKEYIEYIAAAQKEETKLRRIEKIVPLILQLKGLHDIYKK